MNLESNSLFGKAIQSNRKQSYVRFVTNEISRLASLAIHKGSKCISDFLEILEMTTNKAHIDTPLYDGQSNLNVGKILTYNIYCNYIMQKWVKNNVWFIYIDTDSVASSKASMVSWIYERWCWRKTRIPYRIMIKDEEKNHYM